MARVVWKIVIREDKIEEYEQAHAAVWPEVLAVIKAAGAGNYSIYRHETRLFGYYECDDVEVVEQREILVDHLDSKTASVGGGLDVHGRAIYLDPTGVGLDRTRDDLHQRRLAGAIVTDDAQDLAASEAEIDLQECLYVTEGA